MSSPATAIELQEGELAPETAAWLAGGADIEDHVIGAMPCPVCGESLDRCSGPSAAPQPGDFTICIRCFTRLTLDEQLALRELSSDDLAALPVDVLDALNEVRCLVIAGRTRA